MSSRAGDESCTIVPEKGHRALTGGTPISQHGAEQAPLSPNLTLEDVRFRPWFRKPLI